MKDAALIKKMILYGQAAGQKVEVNFSGITPHQLNWKPAVDSWSIGQCLEHLIISDGKYFPVLKKITDGTNVMTPWERWSPFSRMFGWGLVVQLQENVKRKMKTPKMLFPSSGNIEMEILQSYHDHLDTFLDYIALCDTVDLDRITITSPTVGFITYTLRDAFQFLLQHEHRHINQAIRVIEMNGFGS